MKKMFQIVFTGLIVFSMFFCSPLSAAQKNNRRLGFGVMLGVPTGFNIKIWTSHNTAIDGGYSKSFNWEEHSQLHLDFLYHDFDIIYIGIGGRIKFENKKRVGLRVPIGINYRFAKNTFDFFLEFATIFDFAPKFGVDYNTSIGIRFYIKN